MGSVRRSVCVEIEKKTNITVTELKDVTKRLKNANAGIDKMYAEMMNECRNIQYIGLS